jgi:uncharacterized protein (DUF305 family)
MSKLAVLVVAIAFVGASCGSDDSAEPTTGETVASARVPFDQAFIDAMIPHHREAIEMAKAAQARGLTQSDLREIASDIIGSQQREIDQMLTWREQWFGSRKLGPVVAEVLGVRESELGMRHGSAHEVSGAIDADATFAQLMVPHHEGAIAMAEVAKQRAQHDEVRDLAEAISEAQEREIGVLEQHASGEHHG